MPNKIQIKRGAKSKLPTLSQGEFGLCTDTKEVFIGDGVGNTQMATKSDIPVTSDFYVATTAGTGAAYTITLSPAPATLKAGMTIGVKFHTSSTSTTPSLNVNGLGAKTIYRLRSSDSAVVAGYSTSWLNTSRVYVLTYDGTYWIVQSQTQPDYNDMVNKPNGSMGTTVSAFSSIVADGLYNVYNNGATISTGAPPTSPTYTRWSVVRSGDFMIATAGGTQNFNYHFWDYGDGAGFVDNSTTLDNSEVWIKTISANKWHRIITNTDRALVVKGAFSSASTTQLLLSSLWDTGLYTLYGASTTSGGYIDYVLDLPSDFGSRRAAVLMSLPTPYTTNISTKHDTAPRSQYYNTGMQYLYSGSDMWSRSVKSWNQTRGFIFSSWDRHFHAGMMPNGTGAIADLNADKVDGIHGENLYKNYTYTTGSPSFETSGVPNRFALYDSSTFLSSLASPEMYFTGGTQGTFPSTWYGTEDVFGEYGYLGVDLRNGQAYIGSGIEWYQYLEAGAPKYKHHARILTSMDKNCNVNINGNFNFWQRNISFSWTSTEANNHTKKPTADATVSIYNRIAGSVVRDTDVPNSKSRYSIKHNATTRSSNYTNFTNDGNGGEFLNSCYFGSKFFFPFRHLLGKTVSVSFWVKNSANYDYLEFYTPCSIGGATATSIYTYTSWRKIAVSFMISANAAPNQMYFTITKKASDTGSGSFYNAIANVENTAFWIAQVQVGMGVDDFCDKPYLDELRECQRLYEKSYLPDAVAPSNTANNLFQTFSLNVSTSNGARWTLGSHPTFKTPKISTPTITLYTQTGAVGYWYIGGADRASRAVNITTDGFVVANNGTSSIAPSANAVYGHWVAEVNIEAANIWWD